MKNNIEINRREFLKKGGLFTLTSGIMFYASNGAYGAPGVTEANVSGKYARLIPADKQLDPEWFQSLFARGDVQAYSAPKALEYIGMPVGGLFAGTVYLGGDGRLWHWNIRNDDSEGIQPGRVDYKGSSIRMRDGANYVVPAERRYPFEQNFAIRINDDLRTLDADGFKQVSFVGQYPVGEVNYQDADCPVEVQLSAFSPFIPHNTADSSLPVTVMSYKVSNHSDKSVDCDLFGWLENPVLLGSSGGEGLRYNEMIREAGFAAISCSAKMPTKGGDARPDIVYEDFEKQEFAKWTVAGSAFGKRPAPKHSIPGYQGDTKVEGIRSVNSHATAPGTSTTDKDAAVGSLTSDPFTISRKFLHLLVGGGNHKGKTCVNVLVGGSVVSSVTGDARNQMSRKAMDLSAYEGKQATIEIVDAATGQWGNIGADQLVFSDRPLKVVNPDTERTYGTMALAVLEDADGRFIGAPNQRIPGSEGVDQGAMIGSAGRTLKLQPGESKTISFVLAWHFSNLTAGGMPGVGREYAARFDNALEVTRYVAKDFSRLVGETKLWRDTWYDSTLPHWFLDRTMANTSILATTTAYRFKDGRFWAWEGVGCCEGTCTHVWHYAQAPGRLFPDVERRHREEVDFGLGQHADGSIGMRSNLTGSNHSADDGHCGRILGAYREHQMSEDSAFLTRTWPNIKKAIQFMIQRDTNRDGVLEGAQHNTLDAAWFGRISFLASLYLATLRAGEAMATEIGDTAFADECKAIADKGAETILELYNGEYFFHELDSQHIDHVAVGTGCYVDQVFGQFWAHQVGLGHVFDPQKIKSALSALYKYNFVPHTGTFRGTFTRGRWYAMDDDKGLIMCSWPKGGLNKKWHDAWQFGYFNECMSGFEWQAAAHMISEGLVKEGMAVSRAIHDRYDGHLRNPYNEIECSDHYSRAMASYGAFIAASGYESHGPHGYLGFSPKVRDGGTFKCAFTAAGGWGSYKERAEGGNLKAEVTLKWGAVKLESLGLDFPTEAQTVTATLDGQAVSASLKIINGKVRAVFDRPVTLKPGQILNVQA
ncbi:MAG: GH116 family glycosyl hydrolase [Opitutae bacterium]|nr:GH116 family glycosyl hydrolase [Opitutae bacterium]